MLVNYFLLVEQEIGAKPFRLVHNFLLGFQRSGEICCCIVFRCFGTFGTGSLAFAVYPFPTRECTGQRLCVRRRRSHCFGRRGLLATKGTPPRGPRLHVLREKICTGFFAAFGTLIQPEQKFSSTVARLADLGPLREETRQYSNGFGNFQ